MRKKNKIKPLDFNEHYDRSLMVGECFRILENRVKDFYPIVYNSLTEAGLLEAYLEPKIVLLLEKKRHYRVLGLSMAAIKESACRDVFASLKEELEAVAEIEVLRLYDGVFSR